MMRIIKYISGILLLLMFMSFLGAPLFLIISHPGEAAYIAAYGKTFIPWVCLLLMSIIFKDSFIGILTKLGNVFDRMQKASAGPISFELNSQGKDVLNISSEQIKSFSSHIQELTQQTQGANNLANHFFLKYVAVTIYGSQFKFLEALAAAPSPSLVAASFYNQYLAVAPANIDYPFNRWVGYLLENFLVSFDSSDGMYKITPAAENFLNAAKVAGLSHINFNY